MKHIKLIIGVLGIAFTMQAQSITLEECKKMAKENNYSLRNSYLDQQISNQNRKEAFTNYFPKIDASAAYLKANKGLLELQMPNPLTGEASALSLIEKGKTASVSLMQPIFMGGQIFNGNKLAKIGENVSNLQYKLTSDEVERRTELYFWQIVQLKEKLKTISDMEALLKTINQDVQNAIKAGLSTRNDLLRVELQQYEIELNKIKIENGLNTSKLLLSQLVGFEKEDFDLEYNSIEDLGSPFDLYVDAADAVSRSTESGL